MQRGHNFAIVDEVDSILIDEARTPLIISGPADAGDEVVRRVRAARDGCGADRDKDVDGDYEVDEKKRTVGIPSRASRRSRTSSASTTSTSRSTPRSSAT